MWCKGILGAVRFLGKLSTEWQQQLRLDTRINRSDGDSDGVGDRDEQILFLSSFRGPGLR